MLTRNSPAPLRRGIVKLWFALDAIVALAPPLYWAADGRTTPIAGIPAALFYFLAVNLCITASLIAASWLDSADEGSAA
ncbi:hypothetical protein [Methylobacterium sp. J-076]|uniref:hypothetical protein n=1 Tax=Methylobacterium sp. J-076 TaxID=2836655 RepID=UPI001FB8784A|nr:hypothetical protein [Methylobacterium sp. J-076]MCJ2012179.1 hypothetical protein [Methylobacterium sp. J-076]